MTKLLDAIEPEPTARKEGRGSENSGGWRVSVTLRPRVSNWLDWRDEAGRLQRHTPCPRAGPAVAPRVDRKRRD
jgi:hypothetical protein